MVLEVPGDEEGGIAIDRCEAVNFVHLPYLYSTFIVALFRHQLLGVCAYGSPQSFWFSQIQVI